ncbi:MAG: glycosyltransferase family 2 protein [Lentisphaeria bacterium]|nr:glycosyltransferase family 2 protein [Lentisphaeria bacterium]MBQ8754724.1 glycosyltransferase family 2 protein [Lentisphaeria bacterium]
MERDSESALQETFVSVCIPVYGVEKYIERCARSLFEQTMKEDIEFIFVNDCTKDKSIEILERVLSEYPHRKAQTKIIHHKENQGLVAARQTALAHANGNYIIHCDSDDWVDLNLYETMYNKAIETDADVVCCSIAYEASSGKTYIGEVKTTENISEYIKLNFVGNFNSLWTKLYKREYVLDANLQIPHEIIMFEDLLRNSQILPKCSSIAFCPDVYYHYFRGNSNSITQKFSKKNLNQLVKLIELTDNMSIEGFPEFNYALKSQMLFAALKFSGLPAKEFEKLCSKENYQRVLKVKEIPLWKRILLVIGGISYSVANNIVLLLIKIKSLT